MRNATDAFSYDVSDFSDPTKSGVYLKNDEEWNSKLGDIIPGYGKFFARNSGSWMNGAERLPTRESPLYHRYRTFNVSTLQLIINYIPIKRGVF